jgi:hypothetical protein
MDGREGGDPMTLHSTLPLAETAGHGAANAVESTTRKNDDAIER